MKYLSPLSRLCLSFIFITSGIYKIGHLDYYQQVMIGGGFPFPVFCLFVAILMLLGGGIGLLIGWKTRWSAATLVLFLVIASSVFHVPLLKETDPQKVRYGQDEILKNLAMIGGLLKYVIDGSGRFGLDNRKSDEA
ncbi:MAG TPA: DoxX family protein [Thermoanaerobaculia bacterium]